MELSPQSVANTSFKTVKKGYDPGEVRSYLANLSKSIENLQSQATAMEARARAAVARLQEMAAQQSATETAQSKPAEVPAEEAETISRTLLLAQRAADNVIAEAEAEAKRLTDGAQKESRSVVRSAQEAANRLIEDGKVEARRAGEGQRVQIESEVQSLLARREFLLSDVDHLEEHLVTQRDRLREVASALTEIVSKVPGGLGDLRRPLVSAVGTDDPARATAGTAPALTVGQTDDDDDDTHDEAAEPSDPGSGDNARVPAPEVDDAGAASTTSPAAGEDAGDGTPPSGQTNRFLFEDITSEVPNIPARTTPAADDMRAPGEQRR